MNVLTYMATCGAKVKKVPKKDASSTVRKHSGSKKLNRMRRMTVTQKSGVVNVKTPKR